MTGFVNDEAVRVDPDKAQAAVSRCVAALAAISGFEATDESEHAWNPLYKGRMYPAGYVEDLITDIKEALTGDVDAEAH